MFIVIIGIPGETTCMIVFYFNKMIMTDPATMITEPINFFVIFSSLNIRYPKKILTIVESWNKANA